MVRKSLVFAVLAFAMCGGAVAYPQPIPVDPCAPPVVKLTCVLAEGAQLDGSAGFWVPFTYNGTGTPRCVIINAKNAAQVIAASPVLPFGEFPGVYVAEFRGQFNADVAVYGYFGENVSNTVLAKIVNNKSP